ncbi:hypothetical protein TrCOL_g118 [Triparma columacea]|uniref:NAD-dependent epimerase/dehydratase domain-containing protein n=1 Tax=Triparma columacea TaxID=722753 RepID=A0A9W7GEN9_9STRA|nr:hypothetical protein TrCOL_g118 [Triparma columacea]
MLKDILVLGGTGFVGRNLVVHLLERFGERIMIRVADKCPPAMAFLSQRYKRAFDDDRVEFVQCDLTRKRGRDLAWRREGGGRWDIVVNVAAETGDGRDEALYEKRCAELSAMNAERAGEEGTDLYIEMSTAFVYASSFRTPNDEQASTNPITLQAKWKLKGEEAVRGVKGLNWCVFRPAIVYGMGDRNSIMPRAVCAATYVGTGERMDFLWDGGIKMSTVWVGDVCRAVACAIEDPDKFNGKIYNLADSGNSTQGLINGLLGETFGIDVGFVGRIISNVARIHMDGVVEVANEKHMRPWSELCTKHNISTVLSPYISRELLQAKNVNVDGGKIVEDAGFVYDRERIRREDIVECLEEASEAKLFMRIWEGAGCNGEEEKG